jgi:hypothetical protein
MEISVAQVLEDRQTFFKQGAARDVAPEIGSEGPQIVKAASHAPWVAKLPVERQGFGHV